MLEFVRVDHGADGLDQAVGDVEGEDADHAALAVVGDGARLAVNHGRHAVGPLLPRPAEQSEDEPGDPFGPVHRLAQGLALAAAVADRDHIGRQDVEQCAEVPAVYRAEEAAGHLVSLLAGSVEPGLARVYVVPGPDGDLPAVRLGLAGDLGDLPEVVAEDLVEQEDGAFGRRQALQQDEECHGQGIGHLGALRGVLCGRRGHRVQLIGDQRLWQPGTNVGFSADPGGPQVADGQPGGHRGQVGLGRGDGGAVAEHAGQPQEGLLDDVLGIADAPGHPVGDREHQRPILGVVGIHGLRPVLRRHVRPVARPCTSRPRPGSRPASSGKPESSRIRAWPCRCWPRAPRSSGR
jgi:hypothetical protein